MSLENTLVCFEQGGSKLTVKSGGVVNVESGGALQFGGITKLASDLSYIVVSKQGSDTLGNGSWDSPVASVVAAVALATATRNTILVFPGEYSEAAQIDWPNIQGLLLKGLDESGQVVIGNSLAAGSVIKINPTYTASSFEAFLENICIKHTAQIGLQIDNQYMTTKKLLVHLTNVSAEQVSTGDSIDVPHTTAGQAIRIYAKGCDEIEGLVDIICANADDRFRFMDGCTLIGGVTVTGAVAGEVTLLNSVVKTGAFTTDGSNVLTNVGSCYRTDAGVYSQLADAFSA